MKRRTHLKPHAILGEGLISGQLQGIEVSTIENHPAQANGVKFT